MASDHSTPEVSGAAFVESINVGTPHTVEWNGQEVTTSIWKNPAPYRVAARAVNLAGDVQADLGVHGGEFKAIYAYGRDDLEWWSRELGRELGAAAFGENLTVAGLPVSSALVGERWQIGSVELEVTQPRFPCYKLAIKMDDAHFVRRFARANRPGAYLRIVQEGEMMAGDAVEVVYRPDHEMTMREMSRIYLEDHDEAFRLRGLPGLPPEWHDWIAHRSRASDDGSSEAGEEE